MSLIFRDGPLARGYTTNTPSTPGSAQSIQPQSQGTPYGAPGFTQQMTTPWGQMEPNQFYRQRDAFIQSANDQAGRSMATGGVYGGRGAPPASWGQPMQFNPNRMWSQAGRMVQNGYQNPFAQQQPAQPAAGSQPRAPLVGAAVMPAWYDWRNPTAHLPQEYANRLSGARRNRQPDPGMPTTGGQAGGRQAPVLTLVPPASGSASNANTPYPSAGPSRQLQPVLPQRPGQQTQSPSQPPAAPRRDLSTAGWLEQHRRLNPNPRIIGPGIQRM
jgi:hypothetical protein